MSIDVIGKWGPKLTLSNVVVHATLLPNGKVLHWGRRQDPTNETDFNTLNEHLTKSFVWDPSSISTNNLNGTSIVPTTQPLLFGPGANTVNLFCSGHALQPDGSVLVVGGHIRDSVGENSACVYHPDSNTWTAEPPMNLGRWYPSALALPDGSMLAMSGSRLDEHSLDGDSFPANKISQVLRNHSWLNLPEPSNIALPLFPRLHLDPKVNGKVFMAGPLAQSQFLDVNDALRTNVWETTISSTSPKLLRPQGERGEACSVMYDTGKILYIGGGMPPTNEAELINLNDPDPQWSSADPKMKFRRRHHNATILADGSVLVTGGTQGSTFNDLGPVSDGPPPTGPVHIPELWNPSTKEWTQMAPEDDDRCYHSTALLLPDARVVSAGGGEYDPENKGLKPNPKKDSLKTAQLFDPPYLFNNGAAAARPTILKAPSEISYGQQINITVGGNDSIVKVTLLRLGSVTHCCNMNQSFMSLGSFPTPLGPNITVPAPATSNSTPPGHYMLFVLSQLGQKLVPSMASIIRIKLEGVQTSVTNSPLLTQRTVMMRSADVSLPALSRKPDGELERPPVVVGLTPVCLYGLSSCWGAAAEGLQNITDIDAVHPVANHTDSLAYVHLREGVLPDLARWQEEFAKTANESYDMRGIEMTLTGTVNKKQVNDEEQLILSDTGVPDLVLKPFPKNGSLKWDRANNVPKPITEKEEGAYKDLSEQLAKHPAITKWKVTGRLQKDKQLDVREFQMA